MRVLYLHGFASSAQSSKAKFFRDRLGALGIEVVTPDFNEPDFSTLTITRMLAQVGAELDKSSEPVALIGSSLGAFVAVNAAAQERARVDRMILLAPALDFGGNRMRDLGDRGLEEWQRTDMLQVFHYGYGRLVPVHYELYSDATKYDAFNATVEQPVLIFQGTRDTSVDPATVERWAAARSNVELHLLDDDHQLLSSLEVIWAGSARFLGVAAA